MTPHPHRTEIGRALRLVALGLVFVVGAFIAQGEAADAQQVRYTTGLGTAERFTVPAPIAASPSALRVDVARQGLAPPWLAVLGTADDTLSDFVSSGPPEADATDPPPPPPRVLSDRGPPSPTR
jgi:hypothetical protein